MLARVRERLGKVESRALHTGKEQQSASPPLSGHTLELLYQTRFERGSVSLGQFVPYQRVKAQ